MERNNLWSNPSCGVQNNVRFLLNVNCLTPTFNL